MKQLWTLLLIGLAACAPAAEQPAPATSTSATSGDATLQPTAAATDPATVEPNDLIAATATSMPTPFPSETPVGETATTATPAGVIVTSGRTSEGTFFLGAEDAPVTLIDYSDFL